MRIYCVGWHKTGTTSLAEALRALGYVVCDDAYRFPPQDDNFDEMFRAFVRGYDAYVDMPWPVLAPRMMRKYRDWHFIHTTRPLDEWWESAHRHFSGTDHPVRRWAYGEPDPAKAPDTWKAIYEAHNKQVAALGEQVDNYLRLPLGAEDKMERLCSFLGVATPPVEYPHVNQNATQAGATCTSI